MTLSIWKYAHLIFALLSALFLVLASLTGIVLAADAIVEKIPPYRVNNIGEITLAQTIPGLRKDYLEITELNVNHNQFVLLKGLDGNGNDVHAYIDPITGNILGPAENKSDFILWITALHRSLFLKETGRFFIGVAAFLLILIAISGIALVIRRQKGLMRFFSKVAKDYVAQYYHVVLGRLMLIPVFVIAVTGTYLSMRGFGLFPENPVAHKELKNNTLRSQQDIAQFEVFKTIKLIDVKKIEFPFDTEDPDDFFILKLTDRELHVNQLTGKIISEARYPFTIIMENWSLDLHTGRTNIIWAIVLAIASGNILFFVYSGFAMTIKRRETQIKNRYTAKESHYILLAGSENGSTLRFANSIHMQLLASGHLSYLAGLDSYTKFPEATHIIIFTSTHGLGDAPSNGKNFLALISQYPQEQNVNISVVGFGSRSYPDFCEFAKNTQEFLAAQAWSRMHIDLHTINDRSTEQFVDWVREWIKITGIPLKTTPAYYAQKPERMQKMLVLQKTSLSKSDHTFMLTLRPGLRARFTSGDLLAIYPGGGRERLYSIGRSKNNIQLVVKLHPSGIGSGYLNGLEPGAIIKARITKNKEFHFPVKAISVAMIANGTGIAPFLGMIEENRQKKECHLYCGFRNETDTVTEYKKFAKSQNGKGHLSKFQIAYSREQNHCYVMDLIKNDTTFFAALLESGGTIMICGSLAMQRDVENVLDTICIAENDKCLADYKTKGQVLADCY